PPPPCPDRSPTAPSEPLDGTPGIPGHRHSKHSGCAATASVTVAVQIIRAWKVFDHAERLITEGQGGAVSPGRRLGGAGSTVALEGCPGGGRAVAQAAGDREVGRPRDHYRRSTARG